MSLDLKLRMKFGGSKHARTPTGHQWFRSKFEMTYKQQVGSPFYIGQQEQSKQRQNSSADEICESSVATFFFFLGST